MMINKNKCKKHLFILFIITLFSSGIIAGTVGLDKKKKEKEHDPKRELSVDGPYVTHLPDGSTRIITVDKEKNIKDTTLATLPTDFKFPVLSPHGKHLFDVSLHPIARQEWKLTQAEKVVVLSDPHGNFECFAELLQANAVINKQYNWTFGKNQLVIIGDVFDRGKEVLPIFWLIYKLEKEAQEAGGQVIFLLGNHESLVLTGDMRYAKEKYLALATLLGVEYKELFSPSTELGHWLATRNTMQLIGDNLFVHAGLSAELYHQHLSIPDINPAMSEALFLNKAERKAHSDLSAFLYGSSGPIWYRGMVKEDAKYHPLPSDTLHVILNKYNANRVIVGHTIFEDITTLYNGRVIAVNVDNKENRKKGRGRGILIENKKISVIGDKGVMKKQLPL